MKLKKLILAMSLGLSALTATATTQTTLNNLTGPTNAAVLGVTSTNFSGTWAGTNENTWGLGVVTAIQGGSAQWTGGVAASGNDYLYFMIYGIADDPAHPGFSMGATGTGADGKIHIDVYQSSTYLPDFYSSFNSALNNTRTGYSTDSYFTGMTDYLNLVLAQPGTDAPPGDTFYESPTGLPSDGTYEGGFYAAAVGGLAMAQWNTNGEKYGTDFFGRFNVEPNTQCTGSGSPLAGTPGLCFADSIHDPVQGNKVPEPASLAMVGLGLAALARLRRRKD